MTWKGKVLAAFALPFFCAMQAGAEENVKKSNYVVGKVGVFQPTGDLDDSGFDTGGGLSVGYGRYLTDYIIFEASLEHLLVDREVRGENATTGSYSRDDYLYSAGALATLKFEQNIGKVDFYTGAGVGLYAILLYSEVDSLRLGSFDKDDTKGAFGVHGLIGMNYNFTDSIFAGIEAKYRWTTDVDICKTVASIPIEYDANLSGYSVNATVGFRF